MKRIRAISVFLAVVMIFVSLNISTFTSSAATTVDISSAQDLANLYTYASGSGTLTINLLANIDAADISYTSLNTTRKVVFNGNNKYIKNLKSTGYGLFTQVGENSEIYNLGLIDAYVTKFDASGTGYGILCGIAGKNVKGARQFTQLIAPL